MLSLAKGIIARREELGMTQSNLADNAGINLSQLNRIENGHIDSLKTKTRIKLAEALQVDLSFFHDEMALTDTFFIRIDLNKLPDDAIGKIVRRANAQKTTPDNVVSDMLAEYFVKKKEEPQE